MISFSWDINDFIFMGYPMKMKLFGLSETKLFHFHGIFNKNEIKSAKRTLHTF